MRVEICLSCPCRQGSRTGNRTLQSEERPERAEQFGRQKAILGTYRLNA